MRYKISQINYYPVKSLGAVSIKEAQLDHFGIQNDRRFMLVDDNYEFITQRKHPKLSLIAAKLTAAGVILACEQFGELFFPYSGFTHEVSVKVWSDKVSVKCIDASYTRLLSSWLGVPLRMVYMESSGVRQVDRDYFPADQNVSFVDGYPLLLTNSASLKDLNKKLGDDVEMSRFRPNIVFDGDRPFQEDFWKRVSIGGLEFDVVKPCARCSMTTIDGKAEFGKEPLKTLASYRKNEYGVCFGQNLVHLSSGSFKVGDTLLVKSIYEK